MTNLLTVLPDFDVRPYTHLLPSLEKSLISTADLLTLDALDVAKRAQVPPGEVKKLRDALLERLHAGVGTADHDEHGRNEVDPVTRGNASSESSQFISTLDDTLDKALGGGIAKGYLTEIVGERSVRNIAKATES